jgi:hypothetical protein
MACINSIQLVVASVALSTPVFPSIVSILEKSSFISSTFLSKRPLQHVSKPKQPMQRSQSVYIQDDQRIQAMLAQQERRPAKLKSNNSQTRNISPRRIQTEPVSQLRRIHSETETNRLASEEEEDQSIEIDIQLPNYSLQPSRPIVTESWDDDFALDDGEELKIPEALQKTQTNLRADSENIRGFSTKMEGKLL